MSTVTSVSDNCSKPWCNRNMNPNACSLSSQESFYSSVSVSLCLGPFNEKPPPNSTKQQQSHPPAAACVQNMKYGFNTTFHRSFVCLVPAAPGSKSWSLFLQLWIRDVLPHPEHLLCLISPFPQKQLTVHKHLGSFHS